MKMYAAMGPLATTPFHAPSILKKFCSEKNVYTKYKMASGISWISSHMVTTRFADMVNLLVVIQHIAPGIVTGGGICPVVIRWSPIAFVQGIPKQCPQRDKHAVLRKQSVVKLRNIKQYGPGKWAFAKI
jgi:hypothetical protein